MNVSHAIKVRGFFPLLVMWLMLWAFLPQHWSLGQTRPTEISFPTFGLSVIPPQDLSRFPENGIGQVARWARVDRYNQALGMITLEVEPAGERTLEQWAAATKEQLGHVIDPQMVLMGNEKALHLQSKSKNLLLHMDESYVTLHNGYFWIISSYTSPRWSDPAEVDRFRAGLRFTVAQAPAQCLDFPAESRKVFGGISIGLPLACRPVPSRNPATQLQFAIYNYLTRSMEANILVEYIEKPIKTEDDAEVNKWADLIAHKYELATLPVWQRLGDSPNKIIVAPISVRNPGSQTSLVNIHGLVKISNHSTMLVTLATTVEAKESQQAYIAAMQKILASIEPPASATTDKKTHP